jgi:hypothetical protein
MLTEVWVQYMNALDSWHAWLAMPSSTPSLLTSFPKKTLNLMKSDQTSTIAIEWVRAAMKGSQAWMET